MKRLVVALFFATLVTGSAFAQTDCNDGWQSSSTGSGTCSHHGGEENPNGLTNEEVQ